MELEERESATGGSGEDMQQRQVVVSAAFGSLGDLNPMLGLALELQKDKNNRVVIIVDAYFEQRARDAGVKEIRTLGDKSEYEALLKDSEKRDKDGLPTAVTDVLLRRLKPHYEILERLEREAQPRLTVFVAHTAELAVRILQEKRGVPVVTIVLQPWLLRSFIEPSQFERLPRFRPWPRWLLSFGYNVVDSVIDSIYAKKLNAVRQELGLFKDVKGVYKEWFLSPALCIGLFPSWFAKCADWPPQLKLADFPLFDLGSYAETPEEALSQLPEGLRAFVADARREGTKIVAITLGSAPPRYAPQVFKAAVEATKRLGVRLVILHGNAEEAGVPLPPHAAHAAYVPFSALFAAVSAVVHNGGVGTMSQALRAGVPQLIVPGRWDQPDNALRIKSLGLGKRISASAASRERALRGKLERLLSSHDVRLRCDEAAWQFRAARNAAVGPEDGVLGEYGGLAQAARMVGSFAADQVAMSARLHTSSPFSSRQYNVQHQQEQEPDDSSSSPRE